MVHTNLSSATTVIPPLPPLLRPGRRFANHRNPAAQKESKIDEGHLMPDYVHTLTSIPPSMRCRRWSGSPRARARSIHLARVFGERKRNFAGQHLWARGYFVNKLGRDEYETLGVKVPGPTRHNGLPIWKQTTLGEVASEVILPSRTRWLWRWALSNLCRVNGRQTL
jgi:hypothetical protein